MVSKNILRILSKWRGVENIVLLASCLLLPDCKPTQKQEDSVVYESGKRKSNEEDKYYGNPFKESVPEIRDLYEIDKDTNLDKFIGKEILVTGTISKTMIPFISGDSVPRFIVLPVEFTSIREKSVALCGILMKESLSLSAGIKERYYLKRGTIAILKADGKKITETQRKELMDSMEATSFEPP